ncbi:Kinesin light chain [Colletotrichum fructicola Nara gc5]|uniref:Kinesin light chain n=1 Tax=Colletotrichum fructicola (strain Nara gc5) TaxID=1213859 RepID=A0A7J6IFF6_COLFN|nr:Kinesin light chain [Colletotrichum fructicola Nara gc5]
MGLTRLLKKFNSRKDGSAVASSTPQPEAPCAPPVRPFGLEVLVEGTDPVVDIVAVHGLNGHREHTWTASRGKHWLRDFLPTDLPNVRILCWGYDANTHSNSGVSIQYLYDHARELVADLTRKRGLTKSRERPIIFVVHSLGGIVVKSALIHSDTAREGALAEHRSIKTSTHGILFMGTPHQGGNGVQLGRVLVNVASIFVSADDRLLKHLERESEWLQQQLGQYGPISGDFVTKFAYEVYKTPTPLGQITVVPRASAVVPGQADGEPIAIHADHINMVKFSSKEDPSYVKVSEVLQIMVANAGRNIGSRWETEERVTRARIGNETPEKKSGPFYSIPFPDNKGFVGRSETLQVLHSILFRDKCQRVALCGLGGIGKTQVALKLAYLTKQEKPDYSIFWVPASSKETFNEAYLAIARKLGVHVTDDEDLRIALREHLNSPDSGKWLLIIDNADDEGVLYESEDGLDRLYDCLPQSDDGVTLFTTRFSRVATSVAGGNVVDLASMSLNEASDFMRQSLVKALYREGTVLKELLKDLTYLPLAIAQAAAYMNENRTSMQEYLGVLRNTKQDMIELLSSDFHDRTRYKDRNSQNPVATTWFISFSKINKYNRQAAELLMFLSCVEPKGIPRSIMPNLSSGQQLTAAIGTLCAYAFLTQRGSTKVYDMHRLVHVSTSIWIESQSSKDQEADFAVEILENAVQQLTKVFPSDAHENRYLWKEYMPHTLKLLGNKLLDPVKKVDLAYWAGRCLRVDGRIKNAIELLEHVVDVQGTTLDEGHPDRLASQHALARAYQGDGRVKDAIELLEHVVDVRKTTLDEGHPSRLASQHVLAGAYQDDGRVKDAIELLEHVVDVQGTTLDERHPSRLDSQHELAGAYQDDGRVKDAIELLEHVVDVRKMTLDESHPDRLASQHALAVAYKADGRVKDAIELLEHVVDVQETTLDESHPDRLDSQHELAGAYQDDGRVKDAIELLEHVVDRYGVLATGRPASSGGEDEPSRRFCIKKMNRPCSTIPIQYTSRTIPRHYIFRSSS